MVAARVVGERVAVLMVVVVEVDKQRGDRQAVRDRRGTYLVGEAGVDHVANSVVPSGWWMMGMHGVGCRSPDADDTRVKFILKKRERGGGRQNQKSEGEWESKWYK